MKRFKMLKKNIKTYRVTVADRYMYDDYRGYNVYNVSSTRLYMKRFLNTFGFKLFRKNEYGFDKNHTTTYEIYSIEVA